MAAQYLDQRVLFYQSLAFSTNTKKAYAVHRKAYIAFCNTEGVAPIPATTQLLCRYVAHLARTLKYTSIRQYLNIIRVLHSEWGLPNPIINNYQLTLTLRGIRRHLGDSVCRKTPVSPSLLRRIASRLDLTTPLGASIWAGCALMFFGLLRRSNVLVPDAGYDPIKHLQRKDLIFVKGGLRIRIRWTKTIQYRERVLIIPLPWEKTNNLSCGMTYSSL